MRTSRGVFSGQNCVWVSHGLWRVCSLQPLGISFLPSSLHLWYDPRLVQRTAPLGRGEPEESWRSVLSHEMLRNLGGHFQYWWTRKMDVLVGEPGIFKCFFIRIFGNSEVTSSPCSSLELCICKCSREFSGNTFSTRQQVIFVRYPWLPYALTQQVLSSGHGTAPLQLLPIFWSSLL